MIRKPSLLIIMSISMFLIPLPVYAFGGLGHSRSGGHSSVGGRGIGGRGFGGQSSFGSSGFGRYSNLSGHGFTRGGVNNGYSVQRHFSNLNRAHFGQGHSSNFSSNYFNQRQLNQRQLGNPSPGHFNQSLNNLNSNHFDHRHFNNPSQAHFDHRHFDHFDHHDHGHFFSSFALGFGFGAVFPLFPLVTYPYYDYPYYDYPYDYPYPGSYAPYPPDDYVDPYTSYPPADQPYDDLETQVTPDNQSYGDLEIQVTPEHVEIYVDGRFIGMANDFNGSTTVSLPEGNHVVEFRHNGSSTSTDVTIAPESKSVIREEFSNSSKNPT